MLSFQVAFWPSIAAWLGSLLEKTPVVEGAVMWLYSTVPPQLWTSDLYVGLRASYMSATVWFRPNPFALKAPTISTVSASVPVFSTRLEPMSPPCTG